MSLERPLEEEIPAPPTAEARRLAALGRIAAALRGLEFGTVTAVVQNGVVVQVERTEKVRLQRSDWARR